MRGRSLHSSKHSNLKTKGDSQNSLTLKAIDNSKALTRAPAKSDKPTKVSYEIGATTIVKKILEQQNLKGQKHYKLLDIITDPSFLEKCYREIRSKPGNMTKGTDNETLDGINLK